MNKTVIGSISAAALAAGRGRGARTLAHADTAPPPPSATASPSTGSAASRRPTTVEARPNGAAATTTEEAKGGMFGTNLADLATKLKGRRVKLADAVDTVRDTLKPTEQPADPSTQTEAERQAAHDAREAAFAKALASELGIDEAKVASALDELKAARDAEVKAADKAVRDRPSRTGSSRRRRPTRSEGPRRRNRLDAPGWPGRARRSASLARSVGLVQLFPAEVPAQREIALLRDPLRVDLGDPGQVDAVRTDRPRGHRPHHVGRRSGG